MSERKSWKGFFIGLVSAVSLGALAATFQYFQPATGILKGNANTYVTTAAVSADIRGLWSGSCDATTFLRGDGACAAAGAVTSVGLTMPTGFSVGGSPVTSSGTLAVTTTLNGVLHGNGSGFTASNVLLGSEVSGTLPVANGGTNLTTATDDNAMVGNGTTWQSKALPSCADTGGNHLNYDVTTNTFSCGTSSSVTAPTGANPSASLGLSAVNGAAATFMRSDAAPALSQAIAPTWSGIHTWSNTTGSVFSMGGNAPAAGSNFAVGATSATTSAAAGRGVIQVNGSTDGMFAISAGGATPHAYFYAPVASAPAQLWAGTNHALNLYSNGSNRITFDTDGSWDLAGSTPGSSGQVLTSNGSGSAPTWQAGASATSATATYTAVGLTTSPTTTVRWTKIGNIALMSIGAGLTGTSNSTLFTATGTIPAGFEPVRLQDCSLAGQDNGNNVVVRMTIQNGTSTLAFFNNTTSGFTWTNSGTKSVSNSPSGQTCAYALD